MVAAPKYSALSSVKINRHPWNSSHISEKLRSWIAPIGPLRNQRRKESDGEVAAWQAAGVRVTVVEEHADGHEDVKGENQGVRPVKGEEAVQVVMVRAGAGQGGKKVGVVYVSEEMVVEMVAVADSRGRRQNDKELEACVEAAQSPFPGFLHLILSGLIASDRAELHTALASVVAATESLNDLAQAGLLTGQPTELLQTLGARVDLLAQAVEQNETALNTEFTTFQDHHDALVETTTGCRGHAASPPLVQATPPAQIPPRGGPRYRPLRTPAIIRPSSTMAIPEVTHESRGPQPMLPRRRQLDAGLTAAAAPYKHPRLETTTLATAPPPRRRLADFALFACLVNIELDYSDNTYVFHAFPEDQLRLPPGYSATHAHARLCRWRDREEQAGGGGGDKDGQKAGECVTGGEGDESFLGGGIDIDHRPIPGTDPASPGDGQQRAQLKHQWLQMELQQAEVVAAPSCSNSHSGDGFHDSVRRRMHLSIGKSNAASTEDALYAPSLDADAALAAMTSKSCGFRESISTDTEEPPKSSDPAPSRTPTPPGAADQTPKPSFPPPEHRTDVPGRTVGRVSRGSTASFSFSKILHKAKPTSVNGHADGIGLQCGRGRELAGRGDEGVEGWASPVSRNRSCRRALLISRTSWMAVLEAVVGLLDPERASATEGLGAVDAYPNSVEEHRA
ncbi:hypothetical protein LXA43DRAFT_1065653 [Ganoderma leucocontextum]|nr:hypothetical protein LXA43DRAFT_1065653 [Ganoderma leucocontextum]